MVRLHGAHPVEHRRMRSTIVPTLPQSSDHKYGSQGPVKACAKLSCQTTRFVNGAQFTSELHLVVFINLRVVSLQQSKQRPACLGPKTVSIITMQPTSVSIQPRRYMIHLSWLIHANAEHLRILQTFDDIQCTHHI